METRVTSWKIECKLYTVSDDKIVFVSLLKEAKMNNESRRRFVYAHIVVSGYSEFEKCQTKAV